VSSAALKAHVRADGAVYCGAFELQGHPDSVVIVFGDPALSPRDAERFATLERPALNRRFRDWRLGVFAAPSTATPTHSLPPLSN
jgi:hypothetical protein